MGYCLPLTPGEFQDALRKGKGRAYLHVANHGDEEVREILLQACSEYPGYDAQCERGRGIWVGRMIAMLPHPESYTSIARESLRQATQTTPDEESQDSSLIRYFQELLDSVEGKDSTGGPEFGPPVSPRIDTDNGDEVFADILESIELAKYESPGLHGRLQPGRFLRYRIVATPERTEHLLNLFRAETREPQLARILACFQGTALPFFEQKLLDLATVGSPSMRHWTLRAMARVAHPSICAFLEGQPVDPADRDVGHILAGLIHNARPDSALKRLEQLEDAGDEQLHSALCKVLETLVESSASQRHIALCLWIYEHTPCEICRKDAVECLTKAGKVPADMAEELPHDSIVEGR